MSILYALYLLICEREVMFPITKSIEICEGWQGNTKKIGLDIHMHKD